MPKLYVLAAVALLAFISGYWTSKIRSKSATPVPSKDSVSAIIGEMTPEEFREFMGKVRSYGASLAREADLVRFHQAVHAHRVLCLLDSQQIEELSSSQREILSGFAKAFESGELELGDWQAPAATLYGRIKGGLVPPSPPPAP